MKVLYIGGAGRTGSTLLERLLGQTDGVFAGGEMTFLWYALVGDGLCSCRQRLAECPVWSKVVALALADTNLTPPDLVALRGRYWSLHLPLMVLPGVHRGFCADSVPIRGSWPVRTAKYLWRLTATSS